MSALNNGVEWNLSVSDEKEVFEDAQSQFLEIFYADQTVPENKETIDEYRIGYQEYQRKNP